MRRSFDPGVRELEGRLLLAGGGTLSGGSRSLVGPVDQPAGSGIEALWRSTVPAPGDTPLPRGVPLAAWLKLHQKFTLRARRRHDDVLFLGDSFMEGWAGPGKRVWDSQIAPLNAAVFGIHGDETQNLLWRVLHGELSGRPKVAVVMIGANNLALGEGAEETAAGVIAVVHAIRRVSPGTKVLLLGILPSGPKPGTWSRAMTEQVNADISRLAGGHVSYLDIGRRFLQPDGTISPTVLAGYFHPTSVGYQIFAGAIQGRLRVLLSR